MSKVTSGSGNNWVENQMPEAQTPWKNNKLNDAPGVGSLSSTQGTSSTGTVQASKLGGHDLALSRNAQEPAKSTGLGQAFKNFFAKIGEAIGRLSAKSERTEAPAAPPPGPTKPLTSQMLFGTRDANNQLTETRIRPSELSASDRFAGSYSYVKAAAEQAASDPSSFMRSNNNGSALTSFAGNAPESREIMKGLMDVFAKKEVAITNRAFGIDYNKLNTSKPGETPVFVVTSKYDPKLSELPSMQGHKPDSDKYQAAKDKLVSQSVALVDQCMCKAFGKPGDAASVRDAAAKLPQSLCDQIAVLHRGIDDSQNVSADLKNQLKMHAARDAISLRTILPIGAEVAKGVDQTRSEKHAKGLKALNDRKNDLLAQQKEAPEGKKASFERRIADVQDQINFKRSVPAASLMETSKAMQSLVNGVGFGDKDADADLIAAGDGMKDRWNAAFADFVNAAVARADANVVAAAAQDGARFTKP